eukprot:CAMPEP_0119548518 /NCGR_PEP_ID=MMETSP1352-20130426/2429_1 /TAXON_ID=265584 /ORGANISM="Stauroneis constricta, Strain CCMP1120" /LENGTH=125 /DNA_ID=CAMNT_0007593817 /DNA_START=150 /DNA_END=525 /DNA_ORIENTATION=+
MDDTAQPHHLDADQGPGSWLRGVRTQTNIDAANIGNNIGANHGEEWLLTGVWCMVDILMKMMNRTTTNNNNCTISLFSGNDKITSHDGKIRGGGEGLAPALHVSCKEKAGADEWHGIHSCSKRII